MKNPGLSLKISQIFDITDTWPALTKAICDKANELGLDPNQVPIDTVIDQFEPYFAKLDQLVEARLPNPFHLDQAKEIIEKAIQEAFSSTFDNVTVQVERPGNPGP